MSNPFVPPVSTPDDPWGYRDRRVVVTGAASGMGQAAGEILVSLGASVVGVNVQELHDETLSETHQLDLADTAAVAEVAKTIASAGPVDALFNIAGVPGTFDQRTVLAINFCGLHQFTEGLVGAMDPGSAICCVGSTAAVNWPYHVDAFLELLSLPESDSALEWLLDHLDELGYAYDVSKEAVNVYAAWRAISLNDLGVRINCINPGGTFTPASRNFSRAVRSKDGGAEMIENWPKLAGRMAVPSEQAWPMVFLNSPFASFVNGASIYIDAGLTSGMVTQQHHPAIAAGMFWRPPTKS